MKKKIIVAAVAAIVAVGAAWNLNQKANSNVFSDLTLSNVEALAQEHSGGGVHLSCSSTVSGMQGEPGLTHITYCGSCSAVLSKPQSLNSHCS